MRTLHVPGFEAPLHVGKLLCIGRNYEKHAAEMRSEVPGEPMIFLKPSTAIVRSGGDIVIPRQLSEVHHEVELVVVIGRGGREIPESEAMDHVAGYAVGLDMTARDIQARAKEKGHPWTVAKGFDTFAPLGQFVPTSTVPDPARLMIRLTVNGSTRQEGHTGDMIFPVAHLVSFCSTIFTLEPGDLIYTGTPEGVGPVVPGDRLVASIADWPLLEVGVRQG